MSSRKYPENRLLALARQIALIFGLVDPLSDFFYKFQHISDEWRFNRFRANFDRTSFKEKITSVVFTIDPSCFLEKCIEHLKAQTLPPSRIEIVRNVQPFSKAAQEGLDRVKTPYYVSVDDDMILYPECFERLFYTLTSTQRCAESVLRLKDPLMGRIYGVHMYRTDAVLPIGFHPLTDEKGSERKMTTSLKQDGFKTLFVDIIAGIHHPVYRPAEIFQKFKFAGEQASYYIDEKGLKRMKWNLNRLCEYWLETHSDHALYALAGFFDGVRSDNAAQQLSYENLEVVAGFKRIDAFVKSKNANIEEIKA